MSDDNKEALKVLNSQLDTALTALVNAMLDDQNDRILQDELATERLQFVYRDSCE